MLPSRGLIFSLIFLSYSTWVTAQIVIDQNFEVDRYEDNIDSLRTVNGNKVSKSGGNTELAANLALLHYPILKGNRIKIRYKKNVRYPITASWSFWNMFKLRKNHTYILLIKPGTFVDKVSFNKQVGIIGHEMAHFEYYRQRPAITMVSWGMSYIFSKKFRYNFEKEADKTAIERGLGYQLLELSFYITREEVIKHMEYNKDVYSNDQ